MSFAGKDDLTDWIQHEIPPLELARLGALVQDTPPFHLIEFPRLWNLQQALDSPWRLLRFNGRGRGSFVFPCDCPTVPEVTISLREWPYNPEIKWWLGQCTVCSTVFWAAHTELS